MPREAMTGGPGRIGVLCAAHRDKVGRTRTQDLFGDVSGRDAPGNTNGLAELAEPGGGRGQDLVEHQHRVGVPAGALVGAQRQELMDETAVGGMRLENVDTGRRATARNGTGEGATGWNPDTSGSATRPGEQPESTHSPR